MAPNLTELRVLLVEDQGESRAVLRGILAELGITQVYEAPDGKTGLQFMDSANDYIDVILCDWNMPMMSGIDFLRQLRGADVQTPFLMITGRGDHSSVLEAKIYKVDGYLRKPYSPEQIESKLRVMAQRVKAHSAA